MDLNNDFTVNASIEETWKTLTNLELIAPCMPGAQLTEVEGENYRGFVKIKVGPITAQFKGQAHFVEQDPEAHRAVLKAEGRDTGGKGNAAAMITAQLVAAGETTTNVSVNTDLTITGKVAQFGRGALADVSDKLLKQFVANLETTVLNQGDSAGMAEAPAPAAAAEEPAPAVTEPAAASATAPETSADGATEQPKVRKIESKPAEPIDLLETAGAPMVKRLAPLAAVALIVLFLLRRRRR